MQGATSRWCKTMTSTGMTANTYNYIYNHLSLKLLLLVAPAQTDSGSFHFFFFFVKCSRLFQLQPIGTTECFHSPTGTQQEPRHQRRPAAAFPLHWTARDTTNDERAYFKSLAKSLVMVTNKPIQLQCQFTVSAPSPAGGSFCPVPRYLRNLSMGRDFAHSEALSAAL